MTNSVVLFYTTEIEPFHWTHCKIVREKVGGLTGKTKQRLDFVKWLLGKLLNWYEKLMFYHMKQLTH